MTDRDDRLGPMGLERGLDVLECLTSEAEASPHQPGLRFTTLHQRLGIAKPVLSRLLKSLIARGYVCKHDDQRRYVRGSALLQLTRGMEVVPLRRQAFCQLAGSAVSQMSNQLGATAMALYWDGQVLESVASAPVEEGLAAWPQGTRRDQFQRGPWGMFVLAERGEDPQARIDADPRAMDRTVIDRCLAEIAEHDTLLLDRRHCLRAVAAVRAADRSLIGELGILAPAAQFSESERIQLRQFLREQAQTLSQQLDQSIAAGGHRAERAPLVGAAW